MSQRYLDEQSRIVRGRRGYATIEEKRQGLMGHSAYEGEAPRESREVVETEFLVPEVKNFVETPTISDLKNRVKMWAGIGYPPHIVGPTGCGKTTLAMQVAKEIGRPTTWINGDEMMTTHDLIGGYSELEHESVRDRFVHNVLVAKDREKMKWVDNPLTLACKYGYTLVYNEFSRTKPGANNVLLSVLEESILELPMKMGEERYVDVHPDFNVIFTSNSIEYAGVHRPQDALLDRMVDIYMDYYDFNTEMKVVIAHTGVSTKEAKKVVTLIRKLRDNLHDEMKPGTRAEIMICHGLRAIPSYSKDIYEQICIDVLASKIGGPSEYQKQAELVRKLI